MPPIPPRPPLIPADLRRNNYVAIVGDSIAGGSGTASGIRWFDLFCAMTGQNAHYLFNAGVGGQTIAEIMARLDADVFNRSKGGTEPDQPRPGWCFVQCGTNDVSAGGVLADMVADYTPGIVQFRGHRIEPILCSIPPSDSWNTAQRLVGHQWNAWVRAYALNHGYAFADVYTPLVDPADGTYLTGMHTDNTHPSWAGVRAIATNFAETLGPLFPASGVFLANGTSRLNGAALLTNPQFLVDTDADGVADSWSALYTAGGGSVTFSLVADGSTGRNWQRIAVASAPTTCSVSQSLAAGTWSVGDVLELSCRIRTTDVESGSGAFYARLDFTNGSSTTAYLYQGFGADVDDLPFTARFLVPSGTTTVTVRFGWSSGTGTFDIAQPTILNRTVLGLE